MEKYVDLNKVDVLSHMTTIFCTKNACFLTYGDLEMYCKSNNIPMSSAWTIVYYKRFAGRKDVIKVNGKFYSVIDEESYSIYNYKEGIWEFEYGHLRPEYQLLKDMGITLEDDIYDEIDKRNEYIKKMSKDKYE